MSDSEAGRWSLLLALCKDNVSLLNITGINLDGNASDRSGHRFSMELTSGLVWIDDKGQRERQEYKMDLLTLQEETWVQATMEMGQLVS